MVNISRNKKRTNTKKRGTLRILSAPVRYIKSKVKNVYKKIVKKHKKTDNEVYNEEKLNRKSIVELKEIAKLRRIENMGKFKKRGFNY